jgi:hypothetical protein
VVQVPDIDDALPIGTGLHSFAAASPHTPPTRTTTQRGPTRDKWTVVFLILAVMREDTDPQQRPETVGMVLGRGWRDSTVWSLPVVASYNRKQLFSHEPGSVASTTACGSRSN